MHKKGHFGVTNSLCEEPPSTIINPFQNDDPGLP